MLLATYRVSRPDKILLTVLQNVYKKNLIITYITASFNSSLCSMHLTKFEFNFSYTRSRNKQKHFCENILKKYFHLK